MHAVCVFVLHIQNVYVISINAKHAKSSDIQIIPTLIFPVFTVDIEPKNIQLAIKNLVLYEKTARKLLKRGKEYYCTQT